MADVNDDFNLDDDEDESGSGSGNQQSEPFKQLRTKYRLAQKQLKEQTVQFQELQKFKAGYDAQLKAESTGAIFKDMGLAPQHARLFLALNGEDEPSKENIAKFALEYGLGVPVERQEEVEAAAEGPSFVPVSPGGTVPVTQKLSREAFQDLKRTNMEAAVKAVAEGRVEGFKARVSDDGNGAVTLP